MTDTPIADWVAGIRNPRNARRAKKVLESFLIYWVDQSNLDENHPSFNSPDVIERQELGAGEMLKQRFQHLASSDPGVRFTIDNLATRWFNERVASPDATQSRNTVETELGTIMGFFKFHRCPIRPQVQFLRERTRRKHVPTLKEIQDVSAHLDLKYRVLVMIMAQTGARPDSILKVKCGDLTPYRDSEFTTIHFRTSKRGRAWGYPGFLGPEVAGELVGYLRGRNVTLAETDKPLFDFSNWGFYSAWRTAVKKAGLDKTMVSNGKDTHLFHPYTIRSFFKDVLDNAGISKDWVDLLMGHRLSASDEAYTPAKELFTAWKEHVYPQVAFNATSSVADAIEYKKKFEALQAQVSGIAETINEILKRGKGALALTEAEIEGLKRKIE